MTAVLVAYLLLAWATGVGLTLLSRMPWEFEGRLAAGMALGFTAAAMLTWVVAIPLGMSTATVIVGAALLAAVLAGCLAFTDWPTRLRLEATTAARRWRSRQAWPLLAILVPSILFLSAFYTHALEFRPDGLYAGYINIWGDWCTHLAMAGYLSVAHNLLPPQNPFFAGHGLTYPFLPDLFSGQLTHVGIDLPGSLALVSALMSLALVVVFYSSALRLVGNRWAATLGAAIFFLSGGLGFYRLLADVHPAGGGPLSWLAAFGGTVLHPPREYTLDRAVGLQWLNPVLAYLVPQRATLFGWSLGLVVASLLWFGLSTGSRREVLLAGLLLGCLPLVHTSTYLDLLVITGGMLVVTALPTMRTLRAKWAGGTNDPEDSWFRPAVRRRLRAWVPFFPAALLLGLPQLLMILPPAAATVVHGISTSGAGIPSATGEPSGFLRWQPGWLSTPGDHSYHLQFGWFWILNTALLIPLALLSLVSGNWGKPNLRRFLLPAWALFIIPNLVILQPWEWDNTKWFTWWAIPASIAAGLALSQLFRRGRWVAAIAALVLVTQLASGFLDVNRAWQKDLPNVSFRMLDQDELDVAYWARDRTPEGSVFLTGWQNNHPILLLSNRPEVMGFPGWIWTWGLSPDQRQQDVVAMFHGQGGDALLRRYSVSYVVIGPEEMTLQPAGPGADVSYFEARYPVVHTSPTGEYRVFAVG